MCLPSLHAATLDDLLKQVRESAQANARLNAQREQRFLANRDQQAELLRQAESEAAAAQARSDRARVRFEAGQKAITELKTQLAARTGEDAQVYSAARQTAADFRAATVNSYVTAQFPARNAELEKLASGDNVPSVQQLQNLWFVIQQDMTESAKSARFSAEIVHATGKRSASQVVRVGAFTAFSDGAYLSLAPDATLIALSHQPGGYGDLAEDFAEEREGWLPVLIDPTRGILLAQEAERPGTAERIEQGGLVGYVILLVGFAGAAMAIWQLVYLILTSRAVQRQLQSLHAPNADNPLGRVLATFKGDAKQADDDAEVVELRLSEAVLREVPRLERFQSFLRLAVAAGPLLGLIGTVVGMIITFQTITEAGAGDPKLMAAGISQAMIATLLGLGIAIPLLFMNALLASRSRVLVQILDEQSTGLLAKRLEEQRSV